MAWGFFKKIGQAIKKGANWVLDKVIKPVARTAAPILGQAAQTVLPGVAGKLVHAGTDLVSKWAANGITPTPQKMVGMNGHGIRNKYIQLADQ